MAITEAMQCDEACNKVIEKDILRRAEQRHCHVPASIAQTMTITSTTKAATVATVAMVTVAMVTVAVANMKRAPRCLELLELVERSRACCHVDVPVEVYLEFK